MLLAGNVGLVKKEKYLKDFYEMKKIISILIIILLVPSSPFYLESHPGGNG
jgi:hypothetical protein